MTSASPAPVRVLGTLRFLGGHKIRGLAFFPDGERVAVATSQGPQVSVWEWRTGEHVADVFSGDLSYRNSFLPMAISPDGARLHLLVLGNPVTVDLVTGERRMDPPPPGLREPIRLVSGGTLVACGPPPGRFLRFPELVEVDLSSLGSRVFGMSLDPTSQRLACVSGVDRVDLHQLGPDGPRLVRTFTVDSSEARNIPPKVALAPGGGTLVVSSGPRLLVLDCEGTAARTIRMGPFDTLVVTPDGSAVLGRWGNSSRRGPWTMTAVDLTTGDELHPPGLHPTGVVAVAPGSSPRSLASVGPTARVHWDLHTGEPEVVGAGQTPPAPPESLGPVHPRRPGAAEHAVLRSCPRYRHTHRVCLRDPEGGLLAPLHGFDEPRVRCLAFSPDGGLLACGGYRRGVHLHALDEGGPARPLDCPGGRVHDLAFAPDGRLLLAMVRRGVRATTGHALRAWDLRRPGPPATLLEVPWPEFPARIHVDPAGGRVAVVIHDLREAAGASRVPVLSLGDVLGACLALAGRAEVGGHSHRITAAAFLPEAGGLATASLDGTLRIHPI